MLLDDESKNALEESLDLFGELVNSKWFRRTHIILYLNKLDLLRQRIRDGKSLRTFFNADTYQPKNPEYFEEYLGPEYVPTGDPKTDAKLLDEVVEASTHFILEQFMRRNHYPGRSFTVHKSLTATDEEEVKRAMLQLLTACGQDSELGIKSGPSGHNNELLKEHKKVKTDLVQSERQTLRPWMC